MKYLSVLFDKLSWCAPKIFLKKLCKVQSLKKGRGAGHRSAVQCSAVQFNVMQCSAVQYSVMQCSTVQLSTVHYHIPIND